MQQCPRCAVRSVQWFWSLFSATFLRPSAFQKPRRMISRCKVSTGRCAPRNTQGHEVCNLHWDSCIYRRCLRQLLLSWRRFLEETHGKSRSTAPLFQTPNMTVMWKFRPDFPLCFALQEPVSTQQQGVGNACERRLGVFRMGAPEATQNSKCGKFKRNRIYQFFFVKGFFENFRSSFLHHLLWIFVWKGNVSLKMPDHPGNDLSDHLWDCYREVLQRLWSSCRAHMWQQNAHTENNQNKGTPMPLKTVTSLN